MNFLVVGGQFAFDVHRKAFERLGAKPVGLVRKDIRKSSGEIPTFNSIDAALEALTIDFATIAVPPHVQANVVINLIHGRVPVYCEKPLASNLIDAQSISDLLAQLNVNAWVNFEFTVLPAFEVFFREVPSMASRAGASVSVVWRGLSYTNRHRLKSWKSDGPSGGGTLANFGSHVFSLIECFLGDVKWVCADLAKRADDIRIGDTVCDVHLKLGNGITIKAHLDFDYEGPPEHRWTYRDDEIIVELSQLGNRYCSGFQVTKGSQIVYSDPEPASHPVEDDRIGPTERMAQPFFEALTGGASRMTNIPLAVNVQKVLAACYLSALKLKGAWVAVSDDRLYNMTLDHQAFNAGLINREC